MEIPMPIPISSSTKLAWVECTKLPKLTLRWTHADIWLRQRAVGSVLGSSNVR
eukprot:Gb_26339 [translate_table: standard]